MVYRYPLARCSITCQENNIIPILRRHMPLTFYRLTFVDVVDLLCWTLLPIWRRREVSMRDIYLNLFLLPNPRLNLHFLFCPSVRRQIACSKCPMQ